MPDLPQTGPFEPKLTPPAADSVANSTPQPSTVVENVQPVSPDASSMTYGRYALLKEHAQGGLGKVSLARDTMLGRTVALKEIRPDRQPDAESLQRFINEAAITGLLEHPGIVPIYSLDKDADGKPYYAMRFIEGQSLQKAIESYHSHPDPTTFRKLLNHFIAVCNAVGYAHSKGVIHRDLKPDNVMLGDYGETLVVDWGLAKRLAPEKEKRLLPADAPQFTSLTTPEEDTPATPQTVPSIPGVPVPPDTPLTAAGRIMGTPAYMSPEQARGEIETLGPPTDIYALGGILYALLTGHTPFTGNVFDVLQKLQKNVSPPHPTTLRKDVPKALAAVCVKAMAPQTRDRYQAAKELAAEVEHWLADEPTTTYVEPWTVRTRRWVKKRRTLVISGVVVLIAATCVAIISAILSEQGRQQVQTEKENALAAARKERAAKLAARQAVRVLTADPQLKALEKQDSLTEEQVKQLQTLAEFYRGWAKDVPETTEELQQQGKDYLQLGKVLNLLGQLEEALSAYGYALDITNKLLATNPADPEHQAGLVEVYLRRSLVQQQVGRFQEAEESSLRGLRLQEQLVATYPAVPHFRGRLAFARNTLGTLRGVQKRKKEAIDCLQQARVLLEELIAAHPTTSAFQEELAKTLVTMGSNQSGQSAEESYLRARQLWEKLVADSPNNTDYPARLALVWTALGNLQKSSGRLREAAESYQQGCQLQEKLAALYPTNMFNRTALAMNWRNRGRLHEDLSQIKEAEACYQRARQLYEALVELSPAMPALVQALAGVQNNLGILQFTTGRLREAEANLRQARQLREKLVAAYPTVVDYQGELAATFVYLGNVHAQNHHNQDAMICFTMACSRLKPLVESYPDVADFRVNFALACLSLGILQSGQAAEDSYHQARQHLEQLTARDPNNVHHLEKLALVWTGLGNLQKNNGRTSQALDSYQQARLLQEKLVVFQPDKPVCRAALAQTWQGIAQIQQKLGQVKAAEASYRNARQHIELAATQSPALPPYQLMLANICCSLGDLQYKAGQLKEASASYQQARQIKERLVANYPTVLSYQADLATFWFDLGLTQSIVGRFREAEDSFFQALKIRQKLIHDDKNSIHAIELSKIYQFLGNAQAAINRYQEAEASYLEAIKIREKLMAKDPTKTTLLTDLGATYTNVGNVLLLQNKPDKALYWVEKSIDLLSKVNRRASPQSNLHLPLRFAFTCEAQALGSLARYAESVRGWSHVLTYSDSAQQAGVVQVRQHCLQNALRQVAFYVYFGYHQPAAQSVAILTPLTDLPPDTWPQLARVLALCSVSQGSWFLSPPTPEEREKYAAQAVELLKRSRVPGFFGARAQAERWWREAELAPLRERRDFRQLLGK